MRDMFKPTMAELGLCMYQLENLVQVWKLSKRSEHSFVVVVKLIKVHNFIFNIVNISLYDCMLKMLYALNNTAINDSTLLCIINFKLLSSDFNSEDSHKYTVKYVT